MKARTTIFPTLLFLVVCMVAGCSKTDSPSAVHPVKENTADSLFVIRVDYIELDNIERISRFRSGIGHDYSDETEHCRSMKHYFQPKGTVDWGSVKIFSPVSGTISRLFDEWAGTQLHIQPFGHESYTVIIFHCKTKKMYAIGDTVFAGEQLGTHIGSQTMSDIAVAYSGAGPYTLVSYFEIISDSLFGRYTMRGVASRDDLIISRPARDADPLQCSGETFGSQGSIVNWVDLN